MAKQLKRLTRQQKIILDGILRGQYSKASAEEDIQTLVEYGLIQRNHNLGYEPTAKAKSFKKERSE